MRNEINGVLKVAALVAVGFASVARGGNVWWVDAKSKSASETGAELTPFKTIQSAVNAASSGDTVKVKPGDYTDGYGVSNTTSTNRVMVSKKLTIVSTGGKEVTHIVGRHSSDPTYEGCGKDAIRCVFFNTGSDGSILEGFTIRDGGTQYDDQGGNNCGGGVCVCATSSVADIRIVDCVVSNCVGTRGAAMLGGSQYSTTTWAIRTLVCNNRAPGSGTKSVLRYINLFSSVVAHNSSVAYLNDCPLLTVNCTFYENVCGDTMFQSRKSAVLNSILMTPYSGGNQNIGSNPSSGNAATYVTNCISNTKSGPREVVNSVTAAAREQLKDSAVDGGLLMPIASSPAVGFGNVDYLQQVPEEYRDKDFYGNPRTTGGKVNAGAVEGSAQIAEDGSHVRFMSECTVKGRDGVYQRYDYFYPDSVPHMVKVTAVVPDGLHLYRYSIFSAYDATHYPEGDGSFGLYIPPSDSAVNVTPVFTGQRLFVDVEDEGADAEIDGTSDHPYKSIMAAIAAASAATNTIIEVAEGTYSTGEGATDCYGYRRVVIDKPVFIRGAGRGKSIIKGAPATGASTTASPWGCGADAVGCVIAKNVNCALRGFTLTDGYTRPQANSVYAEIRGGGFFEIGSGNVVGSGLAHLLDCTVTNCVATRSAAFGGGCRAFRCLITGVRHTNNGICQDSCKLFGCLFHGNVSGECVGNSGKAYNCTIDASGVKDWILNPGGYAYNCIFVGNSQSYVLGNTKNRSNGSIRFGAGTDTRYYCDAVVADPGLVDPKNNDYRLLSSTIALGAGDTTYIDPTMMSAGYDGAPVVFGDGRPTPGAFQDFVPGITISLEDGMQQESTFSVTVGGETASLTNVVEAGDAVGVTYTGERHFGHFEVDGVAYSAGVLNLALTVPEDVSAGWGRVVAVLDNTYYVSAAMSDDSGNGWTPETAKRRIASALSLAVSGDVVHVAEGRYSEGDGDQGFKINLNESSRTIRARAPVPAGVRLVADGDVEKTVIEGGKAPSATAYDEEGMGPGAVRCVTLAAGASVEGFTLTGGRCLIPEGATTSNLISPTVSEDYNGGGVLGQSCDTATAIGCVITNCCACRGGAGWGVAFKNCRIVGNMSCWNSPAGFSCSFHDCLIDGNKGENTVQNCYGFYSCTYGPNNGYGTGHYSYKYNTSSKTSPVVVGWVSSIASPIRNSIFLQSYYSDVAYYGGYPCNCAIVRSDGSLPNPDAWSNAVVVVSIADLKLDDDFRPCKGSPLIDAGDDTTWEGETDFGGGQRVYNGRIDIGAQEYDWRPDYSADLGAKRFAVTTVAKAVYEKTVEGEKVVAIPSGGILTGVWTPNRTGASLCLMTATLPSSGTLEVLKNGETFKIITEAGTHEIRSKGTVNGEAFTFLWTPAGDAEAYLSSFSCPNGTMLIFR